MIFRLIDSRWSEELGNAFRAEDAILRIVCPFIKAEALKRLLDGCNFKTLRVITRFKLTDFADGASDIAALRYLLTTGAEIRGVRNLHAKLYAFGTNRAIVTSANLTNAAFDRNHELGFVSEDTTIVAQCLSYFDDLWLRGGENLTHNRVDGWEHKVMRYLASGARPNQPNDLGDEGVDAGLSNDAPILPPAIADAPQAFVKFLGQRSNRVPLTFETFEEIRRAACHRVVAYPASKRPRGVEDGALIFIARLTSDPSDIRIFGRAIGLSYMPGRDDATAGDIALRPWMTQWPRFIRVHHAEFIAGTMANGISLNEMMDELASDSFASTQRNARSKGNTDPRHAYRQQAAVELTDHSRIWLNNRLEAAFNQFGKVPPTNLDGLDWPEIA